MGIGAALALTAGAALTPFIFGGRGRGGSSSSSITSSSSSPSAAMKQQQFDQSQQLTSQFQNESQQSQKEALMLNDAQKRPYVDNPQLQKSSLQDILNKLNGA